MSLEHTLQLAIRGVLHRNSVQLYSMLLMHMPLRLHCLLNLGTERPLARRRMRPCRRNTYSRLSACRRQLLLQLMERFVLFLCPFKSYIFAL